MAGTASLGRLGGGARGAGGWWRPGLVVGVGVGGERVEELFEAAAVGEDLGRCGGGAVAEEGAAAGEHEEFDVGVLEGSDAGGNFVGADAVGLDEAALLHGPEFGEGFGEDL